MLFSLYVFATVSVGQRNWGCQPASLLHLGNYPGSLPLRGPFSMPWQAPNKQLQRTVRRRRGRGARAELRR
jgi:hypothetical protein